MLPRDMDISQDRRHYMDCLDVNFVDSFHFLDEPRNDMPHTIAAKKILLVFKKRQAKKKIIILLSSKERDSLKRATISVRKLMDWKFSYLEFYNAVCQPPYLPLEVLWYLHSVGIITLDAYLNQKHESSNAMFIFHKSIELLCVSKLALNEISSWIITGIITMAVVHVFGLPECSTVPEEAAKKVFRTVLENALKWIVDSNPVESFNLKLNPVLCLWKSPVDKTSLHSFCLFALKCIVTYNPTRKVPDVIDDLNNWLNDEVPEHFSNVISKVLCVLQPAKISFMLLEILKTGNVNWKCVLQTVKNFLTSYKDAASHMTSMIDELLKLSLSEMNVEFLYGSFILIRYAALVGPPCFPVTYGNWFRKSFGDGSTTFIHDHTRFEFLMKFLTDLVPKENETNLKVHIENPPHVVENCQTVLRDYVVLAKTRLDDLKMKNLSNSILEKVLQSFEASGKIPTTILEASMFHKHHYLTQFLPALLAPRVLPKAPDVQMKLIEAMRVNGKIPKDIYEKYEKDCEIMAFDDSAMCLDDSFAIEVIGPDEQLLDLLEKFKNQVKDFGKNKHDTKGITVVVDKFLEQLFRILKQIDMQDYSSLSQSETSFHEKVIDELFNCYTYFQCVCSEIGVPYLQLWCLPSDFLKFPTLQKEVCSGLFRKLTKHEDKLSDIDIEVMASCLGTFGSVPYRCISGLQHSTTDREGVTLPTAIFDALTLTSSKEMQYFYKLSYFYLRSILYSSTYNLKQDVKSSLPVSILESLMKKLQFVMMRLDPQHKCHSAELEEAYAVHCKFKRLKESQTLQKWMYISKLTLHEWWNFERNISQDCDYFSEDERCKYIQWCIIHLYGDNKASALAFSCCAIFRYLLANFNKCEIMRKLLTELVHLCPSTSAVFSTSWVYDEFDKAVACIRKSARNFQASVTVLLERFLILVCDLPPEILLEDTHLSKVHNSVLKLVAFINDWVKQYNSRCLSMTVEFTCHILKCLLYLQSSKNGAEGVIKDFISKCPLFVSSVFMHLDEIQMRYPNFLSSTKDGCVSLFIQEVKMISETVLQGYSHKVTTCANHLKAVDLWTVSFALFLKSPGSELKLLTISNYQALDLEILRTAIYFFIAFKISLCISNITQVSNVSTDDVICMIKILIKKRKCFYLLPKYYNKFILQEIVPSTAWSHFCIGVLKVLVFVFSPLKTMDTEKIKLVQSPKEWNIFLSLLLENLHECQSRYESLKLTNFIFEVSEKTKVLKKEIGIFDWHLLQQLREEVLHILLKVPDEAIKNLPQEYITRSDPHLKHYLCPYSLEWEKKVEKFLDKARRYYKQNINIHSVNM